MRPPEWFKDRADITPSGCWNWRLRRDKWGYGRVTIRNRCYGALAHRVCYEAHKGRVGPGLELDHTCRNPRCINPDHLEPVPPRVNNARSNSPSAVAARKTHCLRGHPFSGENLLVSGGVRFCRACMRMRQERRRLAQPAA